MIVIVLKQMKQLILRERSCMCRVNRYFIFCCHLANWTQLSGRYPPGAPGVARMDSRPNCWLPMSALPSAFSCNTICVQRPIFIYNFVWKIMASKDLGEMKVAQLKGELICRNARLYGSKAELVEKDVGDNINMCLCSRYFTTWNGYPSELSVGGFAIWLIIIYRATLN